MQQFLIINIYVPARRHAKCENNTVIFDIDKYSFTSENDKTILCFEKCNYKDIKAFEIYGDNEFIKKVDNERYKVQYCELGSANYTAYTIKEVYHSLP
jgi:hypothetical protein